jgi:hypothetical protein
MGFPPRICILCTDISCHFVLSLHLNKYFLVFCTKVISNRGLKLESKLKIVVP